MYQRSNAIKIQYDDNDTDDNEYNYINKIRNIEFDLDLCDDLLLKRQIIQIINRIDVRSSASNCLGLHLWRVDHRMIEL